MSIAMENAIRELEGMLDTWEFFSKPYDDKDALKSFGTLTIDGDEVQVTNHMMESVGKLLTAIKENDSYWKKQNDELRWDIKDLRRKLEKAQNYAAMSDPRIAGELDKEITWFETHNGEEDLVYGPVELMKYCRDRLRSRR